MTVSLDQARARRQPTPRVPPHDLAAEDGFLGAIILSRQALDATLGQLRPEDFYKPANSHIYQAVLDLVDTGQPVDATTVANRLGPLLEQVGGLPALAALGDTALSSSRNAEAYARIITDRAVLRRLISVASEIAGDAYETDDAAAALDRAANLIYQLTDTRNTGRSIEHARDVITRALDTIIELQENGGRHGVPTGFVDLDETLLGLHPGQLITIAGRPGMGKTALGTQIAVNAAADHQTDTLLATIEMSVEEITNRLISSESRIYLQRIRSGQIGEKDWPHITNAAGRIGNSRLWFYDAATATLGQLRAEIRRLASKVPLGLVIVDYLQLMQVETRGDNRQVEVAAIAEGLKRLAREHNIPVIALAQLSRNVELRGDKRPVLADLRESGAIENASDVVIGIYRDDYYNPDTTDKGIAELMILKHRSGPTGTVKVSWLDHYTRFANMARVGS